MSADHTLSRLSSPDASLRACESHILIGPTSRMQRWMNVSNDLPAPRAQIPFASVARSLAISAVRRIRLPAWTFSFFGFLLARLDLEHILRLQTVLIDVIAHKLVSGKRLGQCLSANVAGEEE